MSGDVERIAALEAENALLRAAVGALEAQVGELRAQVAKLERQAGKDSQKLVEAAVDRR